MAIRAAKKKVKIAEIPGDEPPRIGKNKDSRAWPGLTGRIKGALLMMKLILRELIYK